MRFPNLRYGNPTEFAYYAMGRELPELARLLRRDEKTIKHWLNGKAKVPWWVPEIMRLKRLEADIRNRQMFGDLIDKATVTKLAVVADDGALQLHQVEKTQTPPQTQTPHVVDLGRYQDRAQA